MEDHEHEWKFMGHNGTNGCIEIHWCSVCGSIRERFLESDETDNIVAPRR